MELAVADRRHELPTGIPVPPSSSPRVPQSYEGQPVAGKAEVPSHGPYRGIFSVANGIGNGTGTPGTLGTVRILKIKFPGTVVYLN